MNCYHRYYQCLNPETKKVPNDNPDAPKRRRKYFKKVPNDNLNEPKIRRKIFNFTKAIVINILHI